MVAVVFVVSLSVFLGWGFVNQKKKMSPASRTKPLTSTASSDGRPSIDQKEGLPLPVCTNILAFMAMFLVLHLLDMSLNSAS